MITMIFTHPRLIICGTDSPCKILFLSDNICKTCNCFICLKTMGIMRIFYQIIIKTKYYYRNEDSKRSQMTDPFYPLPSKPSKHSKNYKINSESCQKRNHIRKINTASCRIHKCRKPNSSRRQQKRHTY